MGAPMDQTAMRMEADAKQRQAKALEKEARALRRRADEMDRPTILFEIAGTLTATQAQLHFIHTKAFALEHGTVHVVRINPAGLMVAAGDERWLINDLGDILTTEGFDAFNNEWVQK